MIPTIIAVILLGGVLYGGWLLGGGLGALLALILANAIGVAFVRNLARKQQRASVE